MFAPLHELLASLPGEQRARWGRLWMLSDRRERGAKPLVYAHPLTGLDTLCFHLGGWEDGGLAAGWICALVRAAPSPVVA